MCANWKTAGSHISLWHLRKQVPVNKWHDSLGLSDEDVPVIGVLERSLAGASTLSVLIGGGQMCWESSAFPAVSVRTLCPSVLTPGRDRATTWLVKTALAQDVVSADGRIKLFQGMNFNSYFSDSQTLFCEAPELFSQGMSMLFPRQYDFFFMLIKNNKICHLCNVIYTLKMLAFPCICSSSNSVS